MPASFSGSYTQNFDGLATSGTGNAWTNLNLRRYLDLTVTPQSVEASFELLDGVDPVTGQSIWGHETVMGSSNLALASLPELSVMVDWQPGWQQLDLVMGLVVDASRTLVSLDPRAYGAVPERGVQLPAVRVIGSEDGDYISVGADSRIESGDGADQLFNTDSLGGNVLIAGQGTDALYLQVQVPDHVIGGGLFGSLPLADGTSDRFFLDSGSADPAAGADATLQILDFEPEHDRLYLDGQLLDQSKWPELQTALSSVGVNINAVPILKPMLQELVLGVIPQAPLSIALVDEGIDLDGDPLELILLSGPEWIKIEDNRLILQPPINITIEQLQSADVRLALSDRQSATPFALQLSMAAAGSLTFTVPTTVELRENLLYLAPHPVTSGALGIVKWTLAGDDAALFSVDTDGVVSMQPRDFEGPVDQQRDNTYRYTLIATDSTGNNTSQSVVVNVANVLESATLSITDISASQTVQENVEYVSSIPRLSGGAVGQVIWTLEGDDSDHFTIEDNGTIRLKSQDYEAPLDIDRDNTYRLNLRGVDSDGNSAVLTLGLTISDVIEFSSLAITGLGSFSVFESRPFSAAALPSGLPIGSLEWSLDGPDKALFEINSNGVIHLPDSDYEMPRDADKDNVYDVTVRLADQDQNSATASLSLSIQSLNQAILPPIGQLPILDLSQFSATDTLKASITWTRHADENSRIGFYRVLDVDGTIRSRDGSQILRPGDNGYASAVLSERNIVASLDSIVTQDFLTGTQDFDVAGSGFIAPFAKSFTSDFKYCMQPGRPSSSIRLLTSSMSPGTPTPPIPSRVVGGVRIDEKILFAYEQESPDNEFHFRSLSGQDGSRLIGLSSFVEQGGDAGKAGLLLSFDFSQVY